MIERAEENVEMNREKENVVDSEEVSSEATEETEADQKVPSNNSNNNKLQLKTRSES